VPEDFAPDIIEIKFDKAIPIKVSERLRCTQRTNTFLHRKTLNTPYGSEITVVELTTVTED
jgi:hypothetical protein